MGMFSLPGALLLVKSLIAAMTSFLRMWGSWSKTVIIISLEHTSYSGRVAQCILSIDFFIYSGSVHMITLAFFSMPVLGWNLLLISLIFI